MKHYKTIKVPAQEQRLLDFTTCDLCNEKITQDCWHKEEVELQFERGDFYPEGGSGERIEYHICSECFTSKLAPWLKSQGAQPTISEIDY